MLEATMTSTRDGPCYDKKGTKQCHSSHITPIPYAPSWVSKTLNDIWCSSTMTICIDKCRHKWIF
jgi:hypothetical protein